MAVREFNEREKVGAPVGGIILLFLGILLLMQTTGYLSWSIWNTLWRFWPVLIIVAGINLLFRKLNSWLLSLIIAAILGGCILYAIYAVHGIGTPETVDLITNLALI